MSGLWFASGVGFGLLGGIVLKTALDELERRSGYTPAPLAAPSVRVISNRNTDMTADDLAHALQRRLRQQGRKPA